MYENEDKMKSDILEKGNKDKNSEMEKMIEEQKENNRRKSKIRCRIEHVFGFMSVSMHGLTLRSIGLTRAHFNIGLTNLVYNLCRFSIVSRKAKCTG